MWGLRVALGLGLAVPMLVHRLAAQDQSQKVDGPSIYKEECKSCHGINGAPPQRAKDKYKKIKTLGEENFVSGLSQDSIVTILKKGIDKDMKSFKDKLSDPEMHAVAAYIKELAEKKKKAP